MNNENTYEVVVVRTREVVFKCRLRITAIGELPRLKKIIRESLEIVKVNGIKLK